MKTFDLIILNGLIVNSDSSIQTNIGIHDGKIAQLGGEMQSEKVIDAAGKFVLPGGVDAHVHLSAAQDPSGAKYSWVDDFYVGSQAAIAGGITTIGNMTFQWSRQTLREAVNRDLVDAKTNAGVDFFLHPVLTDPTADDLLTIQELANEGFSSIKIFQVAEYFDKKFSKFLEAIQIIGKSEMICVMHCEDAKTISSAVSRLIKEDALNLSNWAKSRPVLAESRAVERAIEICKVTGTPIYVVHISSEAALCLAKLARQQGLPFFVETRPMYLHLSEDNLLEQDGAKYIGAPPLRGHSDMDALWVGLYDGTIDTVASDHAPFSLEAKLATDVDVRNARQGVSDLETSLPMLFSRGVGRKRISVNRFVELTSTNPAKLFGLWPRKGIITVGADADIVIWDPNLSKRVNAASMYSKSQYSVYEGEEILGNPILVMSRGEIVMTNGEVNAKRGRGKWLAASAEYLRDGTNEVCEQ
jgi:dihydropyrimidinase